MAQNNESQQKVAELRQEVDTFIAEHLTQEMIEGARLALALTGIGHPVAQAVYQRGWIAPDWPVGMGVPAGVYVRSRFFLMPWHWPAHQ